MPWSELNWQASFRGVPFRIEAESTDAGRRFADHRAAQRVFPLREDLGRREQTFTVEAYLHGDDSIEQRDRLIAACQDRGAPGDLVHPLYGVLLCWCDSIRIRTRREEMRIVRLTLTFTEADERRLVIRREPGVDAADAAADELEAVSTTATAEGLEVEGQPQGVLDQASETMRQAGAALQDLDFLSGPAAEVALLADQARALVNQASQLVTSPAEFAQTLATALHDVTAAVGEFPRQALEAYRGLTGLEGPTPLGGPGQAAAAAQANAELSLGLVHAVAIAGMVKAAARVAWESHEEALEARAEIDDLIETLAGSGAGGDAAYQAAQALRTALFAAVPPEGEDLPRLGSVELSATTPALVLAYRLYDDPTRDDEIARRNVVAHPGFLPAGVELQVLTDA